MSVDGSSEGDGQPVLLEFKETMKSFAELKEKYLDIETTNKTLSEEVQELKRIQKVYLIIIRI